MHRLEIDQMLSPLSFVRFKSHKVYIIAYDAVLVATGIAILSGLSGSMPHFAIAFSRSANSCKSTAILGIPKTFQPH